jgi:hypothetical protein
VIALMTTTTIVVKRRRRNGRRTRSHTRNVVVTVVRGLRGGVEYCAFHGRVLCGYS